MELIVFHLCLASPADFSISWAKELLPCCLSPEIRIPETDCGLVCSDVCVCEGEKLGTSLHPLRVWALRIFWAVQVLSLQTKTDRKCLRRRRRFIQGDRTLVLFYNVILWWDLDFLSEIHETSFGYRKPFQGDLLHQNNRYKQRNIFCLPFFSDPMCAPIPHVPLLNTQRNKYVGVNMYYFFVKPRVRSDT